MKTVTKLLSVLIGITILMSSCTELTEWVSGVEDDNTPPSEVTNLKAEAFDKSVRLTWTDPDNSDLSIIRIIYTHGNTWDFFVDPGEEQILIDNLFNNIKYTFLIKTSDESGNASEGVEIKATPFYTIPN